MKLSTSSVKERTGMRRTMERSEIMASAAEDAARTRSARSVRVIFLDGEDGDVTDWSSEAEAEAEAGDGV